MSPKGENQMHGLIVSKAHHENFVTDDLIDGRMAKCIVFPTRDRFSVEDY